MSLGLTQKGIGLGDLAGLDSVGWEKSIRWPSTIGPKLLFAPDEAFEPLLRPDLHSIYALAQQTLNPKPYINPKPSLSHIFKPSGLFGQSAPPLFVTSGSI